MQEVELSESEGFRLRKAGIWDIDELEELERRSFTFGRFSKSILLGFLRHPFCTTIVIERDSIVASAIVLFHTHGTEIASIAVIPEERRKGYAGRLLEEAENISRRRGISSLSLHVAVENDAATSLYAKYGYNVSERVKDYYGAGRDAYYMVKKLDDPAA